MRIGRYEIPDEIPQQGWTHSGQCNCNDIFQLKFRNILFPNYELRFSPFMKKCKILKYRSRIIGWMLPEQLQEQTNKLKDADSNTTLR